MQKLDYSWADYDADLIRLSSILKEIIISGIYGIPRGGTLLARDLSRILKIPFLTKPQNACLVVDDICDSGATLSHYKDCITAVLHTRNKYSTNFALHEVRENEWICYPWESKQDTVNGREQAIVTLLRSIGENPLRDGLKDTPERVAKAYNEWFRGYTINPKLTTFPSEGYSQIVLLKDIQVYSHCEHHLAPFRGRAHVAYIPKDKIIGLSKLARIVDMFSRRLQNQERLTQQIVEKIQDVLDPIGIACIVECEHFCMRSRGVNEQSSIMKTSKLTGAFLSENSARHELFDLLS